MHSSIMLHFVRPGQEKSVLFGLYPKPATVKLTSRHSCNTFSNQKILMDQLEQMISHRICYVFCHLFDENSGNLYYFVLIMFC